MTIFKLNWKENKNNIVDGGNDTQCDELYLFFKRGIPEESPEILSWHYHGER